MGQGGRAGSWAAFGNRVWEVAATGGQTRHRKGAEGSQARLAQPWAGASPAQQERWEMRFGPQNHAGSQGKGGGVEEALGPGAQGWGNEPRWPWNVSGPCERFLVLSLCQVGQEGTGVLLWFGLSRTQRSQCWMQPQPRAQGGPSSTCSQPGLAPAPGYSHGGFHARGAKPGPGSVLHCSSAL